MGLGLPKFAYRKGLTDLGVTPHRKKLDRLPAGRLDTKLAHVDRKQKKTQNSDGRGGKHCCSIHGMPAIKMVTTVRSIGPE